MIPWPCKYSHYPLLHSRVSDTTHALHSRIPDACRCERMYDSYSHRSLLNHGRLWSKTQLPIRSSPLSLFRPPTSSKTVLSCQGVYPWFVTFLRQCWDAAPSSLLPLLTVKTPPLPQFPYYSLLQEQRAMMGAFQEGFAT